MILLQPEALGPAVDAADRAIHSNIVWLVLAILLGAGCVHYLVLWLYERKVLEQQANLSRLYELAESILLSEDPRGISRRVAEVAAQAAQATHGYVLLLNTATQQLEYVAASDKPPVAAVSLSAISGPITCFRTQAVTEVPDAENCPFVNKETVHRWGQKSLLYVPIKAEGECLGVIELEDRLRKRIFSSEQKTRVRHIARLVALGLRLGDQRAVRDQLHQTEKMAAVTELIDGLAQELLAPLGKVRELADGARAQREPQGAPSCLEEIDREVCRASENVDRLVRLARSRRSSLDQIDFNQLLEKVASRVRRRWVDRDLHLALNLSKSVPQVWADPRQLEEVLLNLMLHAEHLLENLGGDTLRLGTNLLESHVLISIVPGDSQRAVPSFEQSSANGFPGPSAVRLSVCRNLIEGLGGTLRVRASAGGEFSIEIDYPLSEESQSAAAAAGRQDQPGSRPGAQLTALVVDHDAELREALLHQLSERGYRVVPVSTEEEASDLCQQMRFDAVFCGLEAGRMSGLKVYQRVRSQVGKFFFIVDANVPADSLELLSGEGQAVLSKPLEEEELDRVLGTAGAEGVEVQGSRTTSV